MAVSIPKKEEKRSGPRGSERARFDEKGPKIKLSTGEARAEPLRFPDLSFPPLVRFSPKPLSDAWKPGISLEAVFRCCRFTFSFDPPSMASGELLNIEPQELKFPCTYSLRDFAVSSSVVFRSGDLQVELKKQISCSLQLSNKTDNYVAFKVKTTNPKKYCVRPNTGIVLPRTTCDVTVTMQAQREAPPDMQCKDKFLLQSVVAPPGATAKDITAEMESGNLVEECKLRVVYVPPPQPPSPVREGSEEGSSPRASLSDNGNSNSTEFGNVSRAYSETQDKSSEAKAVIARLTEEKNSTIQLNNKLRRELVTQFQYSIDEIREDVILNLDEYGWGFGVECGNSPDKGTSEARGQQRTRWEFLFHSCGDCGLAGDLLWVSIEEDMIPRHLKNEDDNCVPLQGIDEFVSSLKKPIVFFIHVTCM
ncbi:hypothetical protein ACLOJK_005545 [Asimina triloba]